MCTDPPNTPEANAVVSLTLLDLFILPIFVLRPCAIAVLTSLLKEGVLVAFVGALGFPASNICLRAVVLVEVIGPPTLPTGREPFAFTPGNCLGVAAPGNCLGVAAPVICFAAGVPFNSFCVVAGF